MKIKSFLSFMIFFCAALVVVQAQSQKPVYNFPGHDKPVDAFFFSDDDHYMVTTDDESMIVWDMVQHQKVSSSKITKRPEHLVITKSNKLVFAVDTEVFIYDLMNLNQLHQISFEYDVITIIASPTKDEVMAMIFDFGTTANLNFIDVSSGKIRITGTVGKPNRSEPTATKYSPDGTKVFNIADDNSGKEQSIIEVISALNGTVVSSQKVKGNFSHLLISESQNSLYLLKRTNSLERDAIKVDMATLKQTGKVTLPDGYRFNFTPGSTDIITQYIYINITNTLTGETRSLDPPSNRNLAISKSGIIAYTEQGEDKRGLSWYNLKGELVFSFNFQNMSADVKTKLFTPELVVHQGHGSGVNNILFSPDKRLVVTSAGGRVLIWNYYTKRLLKEFVYTDPYTEKHLSISRDSRYLAVGWFEHLQIIDLKDLLKEPRNIPGNADRGLLFSHKADLLAITDGGNTGIYNYLTDTWVARYEAWGNRLRFTDDGNFVFTGLNDSGDPSLVVFDLVKKQPLFTRNERTTTQRVYSDITPNGKYIYYTKGTKLYRLDVALQKDELVYEGESVSYGFTLLSSGELFLGDKILNIETRQERNISIEGAPVILSEDRKYLSTFSKGIVEQYTLAGEKIYELPVTIESPLSVAFHPLRPEMVICDTRNKLRVIDLRNGKTIKIVENVMPGMAFTPDGKSLFVQATKQENVRFRMFLLDGNTYETVKEIKLQHEVYGFKFISDTHMMVSGDPDYAKGIVVYKYNSASQVLEKVYSYAASKDASGFEAMIESIAGDTDLISFTTAGGGMEILSLADKTLRKSFKPTDEERFRVSAHSRDGMYIATSTPFKLRNAYTLKVIREEEKFVEKMINARSGNKIYCFSDGGSKSTVIDVYDFDAFAFTSQVKIQIPIVGPSISHDEKYVAAVNLSSVDVFNLATGHLTCSVVLNGNNHMIITPNGEYFTSSKDLRNFSFNVSKKEFPFEQFDAVFNNPGAVLSSLGYQDKELVDMFNLLYAKRVKQLGKDYATVDALFNMPEIKITAAKTETKEKMYTFTASITSKKYQLQSLLVYINDVPVYGSNGIPISGTAVERPITVELLPGRNKIQVMVVTDQGIESLQETFDVFYEGVTERPDLYLLNIGVSAFKDADYNLTYAAKDAGDIAALYKTKTDYFASVKTLTITDGKATKVNIKSAQQFLSQSKPKDVVIVSIASHGTFDSELNYYLATTDMDFNNPQGLGLMYQDFEALFDNIQARKKLVFIDACHSGEIDKDDSEVVASVATQDQFVKSRGFKTLKNKSTRLQNSVEFTKQLFADVRKGTGAVVISAASGDEFAYESAAWHNGVFTYAMLEGLKTGKADQNNNKEVTVSELREYIVKQVEELTGGKQHPTSRAENIEFDFRVW